MGALMYNHFRCPNVISLLALSLSLSLLNEKIELLGLRLCVCLCVCVCSDGQSFISIFYIFHVFITLLPRQQAAASSGGGVYFQWLLQKHDAQQVPCSNFDIIGCLNIFIFNPSRCGCFVCFSESLTFLIRSSRKNF